MQNCIQKLLMIYGYLTILALYFLLFFVARKEEVPVCRKEGKNRAYPGERLFLKAAAWSIRQKEYLSRRCGAKKAYANKRYRQQYDKSRLGKNLRLLRPDIAEKHQVREFYIRQYSLVMFVFFVGNLISLCVALSAQTNRILQEGGYINRNAYGEGDTKIALLAQIEDEEEKEISYIVEAQRYKPGEVETLFKEASACLPEQIVGENSSLDFVVKDLNLLTSIKGYPFQISWESSKYSLIHTDGTVCNEKLENAEIVMLKARFRYEETEFEEIFPVQVQPAVLTEEELLIQKIHDSLEMQSEESKTDEVMILPKQIGDKGVIWKEVVSDSSAYFFLLMSMAALFVYFAKRKEVEEKLEKRNRELLLDYPEIVNKLTLYMGAGMTIRNAFQKMGEDYKRQKGSGKQRYVYEEILLLCNELQSGISEQEVYAHLGKRCQLQPYMKLSALLAQNLRKGSNDLLMLMQQETAAAFEQRKNAARKAGEEAGTKLLLPMMMMLCIVMVLIMIPAYFSF